MTIDEAITEMLSTMSKGQYLLFAEAVRQLGGELRIDPRAFAEAVNAPAPKMNLDAEDGPIVLRLAAQAFQGCS